MERDINVVAHVKKDGTVWFGTGDGLLLDMGGGGEEEKHLYRHDVVINDKTYNHGYFTATVYSSSPAPIQSSSDLGANGPAFDIGGELQVNTINGVAADGGWHIVVAKRTPNSTTTSIVACGNTYDSGFAWNTFQLSISDIIDENFSGDFDEECFDEVTQIL